ncbi:EpsG family protein [Myroides odoratimimus]|uniref:EpsG family protein n=1 Tax=Myroides odoratimimus TaxID=76832 RepID=UPI002577F034|nr:EpsG family protein [Myroides odoratimimus]MDM1457282.1 EpsG family protein [Myroides odoratimimus]
MNGTGVLTSSYKINKQYNYSILAFVCFLISPLLSLPFILLGIYNREKFSLFVLSLFFGVLSYYLIPTWELDISRYYIMYQEISNTDFVGFKAILEEQNDYLFFFIYYVFSRIGFSFQYFLLIASTIGFYSCFIVADLVIKKYYPSRQSYFILMISFVLSLPILAMVSVTRFSIGFVFFMLFIYYHLKERKKTSYIYFALSCFTHFAFSIFIPFIIIFYFIKNRVKINSMLVGVGAIVIFFSLTGGLMGVLQYIPFLATKAQTYLTIFEDTNIKILSTILIVPVFISLFFYMKFYQVVPSKLLQVYLGTLLVALVCIPTNMIIYDRYIQVFKPVFALTIMATCYSPNMVSRAKILLLKKIVFIATIFYAMYYFYTFYIIYKDSFRGFISLSKLLLISILDSSYTQHDFY